MTTEIGRITNSENYSLSEDLSTADFNNPTAQGTGFSISPDANVVESISESPVKGEDVTESTESDSVQRDADVANEIMGLAAYVTGKSDGPLGNGNAVEDPHFWYQVGEQLDIIGTQISTEESNTSKNPGKEKQVL